MMIIMFKFLYYFNQLNLSLPSDNLNEVYSENLENKLLGSNFDLKSLQLSYKTLNILCLTLLILYGQMEGLFSYPRQIISIVHQENTKKPWSD